VAGGYDVSTAAHCIIQESFELDVLIAQYIWIGGHTTLVQVQHITVRQRAKILRRKSAKG